jgi:hypothetical protein
LQLCIDSPREDICTEIELPMRRFH